MNTLKYFLMIALMLPGLVLPLAAASPAQADAAFAPLDKWLESYARETDTPGMSVVVVSASQTIYQRSFKMTQDTPAGIADLTMLYTAMAVYRLHDAGKLSLDDPATAHLPWFRTADKAQSDRITIQMLLDSSSGIPRDESYLYNLDRGEAAMEQAVRQLASVKLLFEPGSACTTGQSNNMDYAILGLIVARHAGSSFEKALQHTVVQPLGLKNTSLELEQILAWNGAQGHFPKVYEWEKAKQFYRRSAAAGKGTMVASAMDLGRTLQTLLHSGQVPGVSGPAFLGKDSLENMFASRTVLPFLPSKSGGSNRTEAGASVWRQIKEDGYTIDFIYGGTQWTSAIVMLDRSRDMGVAICFNYEARHLDPWRFVPPLNLAFNTLRLADYARALAGDTAPTASPAISTWARPRGADPLMQRQPIPAPARIIDQMPFTGTGDDGGTIRAWYENGQVYAEQIKMGRVLRFRLVFLDDSHAINDSLMYRSTCDIAWNAQGQAEYLVLNGHAKYYLKPPRPLPGYIRASGRLPGLGQGPVPDLLLPELLQPLPGQNTTGKGPLRWEAPEYALEFSRLDALPSSLEELLPAGTSPRRSSPVQTSSLSGMALYQQVFELVNDRAILVLLIQGEHGAYGLPLEAPAKRLSTIGRELIFPLVENSAF